MQRHHRKSPVQVTPYLIEAVRQASLSELQSEIACRLGVGVTTVSRIQRRFNFPHFDRQTGRVFARKKVG